jgi:hypothetical protein
MFCVASLVFGGNEGVEYHFHVLRFWTHFRWYRGRLVPFSYFALPDSFTEVWRALGPFLMFCAPRLFFGSTESVGSRFHVLCSLTHFRRCRVRRVPVPCFAHPNSFSTVLRASGPIFMFYAPGLIFGGVDGIFMFYAPRVPFSCFKLTKSFSAVPRVGPVFIFSTLGLVVGGTEGVGYRFLFLRSQTRFPR